MGWLARSGRWHKWGKDWSILAGKTHIQTRKLAVLSRKQNGSFRDNTGVSVIIYRVSVFVYGETVKNKWINDNVRKGLFNGSFLLSALEKWSFRAIG